MLMNYIRIMSKLLVQCQPDLSLSSFSRVRRLLPYTKGCLDRWSGRTPPKLQLENNKNGFNYFRWLSTCVPVSCFSMGFYRANDTIAKMLIMHSCFFCDDDCHQGRNQVLTRQSTPSFLRELSNHTNQNPLIGVIC